MIIRGLTIMLGLAATVASTMADSGFTGVFDFNNWIFVSGGADASRTASATTISLQGSMNADDVESQTTFYTTVSGTYYLTFNWAYVTDEIDPEYDPAGYLNNGLRQLSNDAGANSQSGNVTSVIFRGGTFGFYALADNFSGVDGRGTLTITNFQFSTTPNFPRWTGGSSGNWNSAANWSGGAVPNGEQVAVEFGASTRTSGTINTNVTLDSLRFVAGGSSHTLVIPNNTNRSLTLVGEGIVNNSGTAQRFTNNRDMVFRNSASAGNAAITNSGNNANLYFWDNASAGQATIANQNNGHLYFLNASTAGQSTITNQNSDNILFSDNASAGSANITMNSGVIIFQAESSAGNANITINNNATVYLWNSASAGNANIAVNGSSGLIFSETTSGGTAAVTLNGGWLQLDQSRGLTLGALSGNGYVWLGGRNLTVGSRNTSTTVSASITDLSSFGGTGGSLTKTGSGAMILTGENSYTGGTRIVSGTVVAGHNQAMGTGTVVVETGATFLTDTGIVVSNTVSLAGGTYSRKLGANTSLANVFHETSNLGGVNTTATILSGTLSFAATLSEKFSAPSGTLSDVYSLSGMPVLNPETERTDLFVLQLSFASLEAGGFLGWFDSETNSWVNAIEGNTGNNAAFTGTPFAGSFASFQSLYDTNLAAYIGAWGMQTQGGTTTAWAVLNHNSDFSVVPEPSSWALAVVGIGFVMLFRRRM